MKEVEKSAHQNHQSGHAAIVLAHLNTQLQHEPVVILGKFFVQCTFKHVRGLLQEKVRLVPLSKRKAPYCNE